MLQKLADQEPETVDADRLYALYFAHRHQQGLELAMFQVVTEFPCRVLPVPALAVLAEGWGNERTSLLAARAFWVLDCRVAVR